MQFPLRISVDHVTDTYTISITMDSWCRSKKDLTITSGPRQNRRPTVKIDSGLRTDKPHKSNMGNMGTMDGYCGYPWRTWRSGEGAVFSTIGTPNC